MEDMKRRGCAIAVVLFAFLCVFLPADSEGSRNLADNFLDKESSWNVHDIDEDTAENLWIRCWNRLKERSGVVESLEFYPFEESKLDKYLYVRIIIHKVISDLPSPEQNFISECLKEEISKCHKYDRLSSYRSVFSRLQEKFSDWFTIPRRFLRYRKHHHRIIRSAMSPSPSVSSPNPAPTPSYRVPASYSSPIMLPPSPLLQPLTMAPRSYAPKPNRGPTSSPSPSNSRSPVIHPHRPPPITTTPTRTGNEDEDKKFIAVVSVGVVAGLGVLALLFFCLVRGGKTKVGPREDQQNGMQDGKPLLNVSSSDISAGIKIFQSLGNSSSTLHNKASSNGLEPPSPSGATDAAPGNIHSPLPLPPGKSAPPPPGPPPPPPPKPPAPCPPPPPKLVRPPPNPPKLGNKLRPSPLGPHRQDKNNEAEVSGDSDAPKAKLKPFFWEKVPANPDHSMVWHDIRAGSFQFNEEMIESLFGYTSAEKNNNDNKKEQSQPQYIQIIDAKKAQNLAILLKALNVTTEEVCDAVKEGNELPLELIHTLVKMAPTTEEEFKLRAFSGEFSQLGPAERFLKVMVDIPFAFKRLEALAFMCSFHEEVSSAAESFKTLEVACNELKNSRLFLKLLEAVLKTGNRMNVGTYRGGAQAFKLDTLLKLSDVKGTDGKTTLLHFVIQEIIRSEGLRAARRFRESTSMSSVKTEDLAEDSSQETEEYHRSLGLQAVSTLSVELENVRKAALIDGDSLATTVSSLGQSLKKSNEFLKNEMSSIEEESEFCSALANFLKQAETEITKITEDEKRILALVKSTGDYFHGNTGRDEGLRPFVIVRDFLIMVDKACKDVKNSRKQPKRTPKKETLTYSSSCESRQESLPDLQQRLFPAIKQRQMENSSSSSSSSSNDDHDHDHDVSYSP